MKPERVEDTINLLEGNLAYIRIGNFHAAIAATAKVGDKVADMKGPKQGGAFELITEITQFLQGGQGAFAAEKVQDLIELVKNWKS
jgi:hypothetical protein